MRVKTGPGLEAPSQAEDREFSAAVVANVRSGDFSGKLKFEMASNTQAVSPKIQQGNHMVKLRS